MTIAGRHGLLTHTITSINLNNTVSLRLCHAKCSGRPASRLHCATKRGSSNSHAVARHATTVILYLVRLYLLAKPKLIRKVRSDKAASVNLAAVDSCALRRSGRAKQQICCVSQHQGRLAQALPSVPPITWRGGGSAKSPANEQQAHAPSLLRQGVARCAPPDPAPCGARCGWECGRCIPAGWSPTLS